MADFLIYGLNVADWDSEKDLPSKQPVSFINPDDTKITGCIKRAVNADGSLSMTLQSNPKKDEAK